MAHPVTDPLVSVENLSVGYGAADGGITTVLNGVSLSIAGGETVGIVGESGSGKSTLARALLGYLRGGGQFTGGQCLIDGLDVTQADRSAIGTLRGLKVAMVPQNPLASLTYHIPVGRQVDEVLMARAGLDRRAARQRTLDLFTEMGLPDPQGIVGRYPHQLSGGQRQRVVIAAALACDPKLLVLDEPTTALDKTTEAQVLDLVQRLREARGSALVLVSHDLNVVARVCQRVIVMKDGRIVEQGPVARVFSAPATDYTKTLLAASLDLDGPSPAGDQPPSGKLIEARSLDFAYRGGSLFDFARAPARKSLDGVDLTLDRGSVIGVIGESGSGKTTLAMVLSGLLAPNSGSLTLDGRSIAMAAGARSAEARRRIQIVFQDPLSSLNPRQTVGAAIMRPLQMFFGLSRAKARARAGDLIGELGLSSDLLERYPRQLSGGQQQRIAIARAFAAEPDLLVCDEITSALDASVQAQLLGRLQDLQRRNGTSMIVITHDLAVIWRLAPQVIVMKDGRIVDAGRTADIFSHPTSDYTRLLLEAATATATFRRPAGSIAPDIQPVSQPIHVA
ncbi:ABC transporter ATP-binding protein [Phreatobacter aquaticus]|uniref:ABC transporter ATP-binding protein n=1 Tax=Phreatobacter aquaticus TaxID=2570229 RepID=A0A4D7QF31_9HYPH|nr:ABC transporter ATP-binding protein [Phreatobacter aquaticus]QCK85231.1 ABC transporter ATP-binding protein [Phreatobacter aquaticus]